METLALFVRARVWHAAMRAVFAMTITMVAVATLFSLGLLLVGGDVAVALSFHMLSIVSGIAVMSRGVRLLEPGNTPDVSDPTLRIAAGIQIVSLVVAFVTMLTTVVSG